MSARDRSKGWKLWLGGAAALMCLAPLALPVQAQDASTYYTVQHPKDFKIDWAAVYRKAEAMTAETRAELPHFLDIPYGSNVKQRLDLYLPIKKPKHAAVLLFLHGGGFREGDRAQYGFVARPYAAHGIITAVASYRLTGDGFKYPDQPEDARLALQWLYRNVAQYGGDPGRLYLAGHSAGAILSADLGVDTSWMQRYGIPTSALRGIAPVSGIYIMAVPDRPGELNVYASTAELAKRASPLLHVTAPVPAAVIAVGGAENSGQFAETSQQLADKMKAAGVHATFLLLKGEDHKDTVLSFADEHSELFQDVLRMINGQGEIAAH
jgi:acetyl esterase/lipase